MESNIKHINLDQYHEDYIHDNSVSYSHSVEEIELPVGIPFIYLNETIDYYADCNNRKSNYNN